MRWRLYLVLREKIETSERKARDSEARFQDSVRAVCHVRRLDFVFLFNQLGIYGDLCFCACVCACVCVCLKMKRLVVPPFPKMGCYDGKTLGFWTSKKPNIQTDQTYGYCYRLGGQPTWLGYKRFHIASF